jgi:hypothetical protein
VRDGINAIRYTLKRKSADPDLDTAGLFEQAVRQILGEEALDLDALARKRRLSGDSLPSMNLGDFFFPGDDELNPDAPRNPGP